MPKSKLTKPSQNLQTELKALEAKLARAVADYQNLEKRFERDSSSIIKFGQVALLEKLLSFRDHLELASRALADSSLTLLLSELDKLLQEEGVEKVDTTASFDPNSMECAELAPGPKDTVVSVVREGFCLHDRVLRPARVVVGSGNPNKSKN